MENQLINIYPLHGFLGLGSDWDPFRKAWFDSQGEICRFNSLNLLNFLSINKNLSLYEWAHVFNQQVLQETTQPAHNVLIGYSMGGRLALHALLDEPKLWKGAVLISCHPGLESEEEKQLRIQNDAKWGKRFSEGEWNEVIQDWNAQPVFQSQSNNLIRNESDFDRQALVRSLDLWGLGRQESLWAKLADLTLPILWLSGEKDEKYGLIGERASKLNSRIQHRILPKAGHRLPWEARDLFIQYVQLFMDRL